MESKLQSGIKVYGSAVLRVEPDVASIQFAVSREAKQPKDAFQETHKAVKKVREFLERFGGTGDVAASRINLFEEDEYINGRHQKTGYSAKVSFNVLLSDLGRIEELLVGVVDAGANHIDAVVFQTKKLKEFRADARRRAVAAGREKAENYCRAAGVMLGEVVSLEDVNPDSVRGSGEGHTSREVSADDAGAEQAFTPGSIVVGAAVYLTYSIMIAAPKPNG